MYSQVCSIARKMSQRIDSLVAGWWLLPIGCAVATMYPAEVKSLAGAVALCTHLWSTSHQTDQVSKGHVCVESQVSYSDRRRRTLANAALPPVSRNTSRKCAMVVCKSVPFPKSIWSPEDASAQLHHSARHDCKRFCAAHLPRLKQSSNWVQWW